MKPFVSIPRILLALATAWVLVLGVEAQEPGGALPVVVVTGVPQYPPLAKAARVEGIVHVKVTTDGHRVVSASAEDGPKLLRTQAEENARTWEFASHTPMTFTVKYQYKLTEASQNNPYGGTVILRLPSDVEVIAVPLVISDPAPDPQPKAESRSIDPETLAHEAGHVNPPKPQ